MVPGGDDESLVQLACLLQLLQQQLQGTVYLHNGGHVVLGGLAIRQCAYLVQVGLDDAVVGIGHVSADGQVVDVEGLVAIDVVIYTVFDDLSVPGGPGDLAAGGGVHVQAGTELFPGVAQVGVGGLTAIHVIVSVVAQNLIALPAQLLG